MKKIKICLKMKIVPNSPSTSIDLERNAEDREDSEPIL